MATAGVETFSVIKVNKKGKAQSRVLELNFTDGIISNLNTKGKVQKTYHASTILLASRMGKNMLVVAFPDQKDYKLSFESEAEREQFCAKLGELCTSARQRLKGKAAPPEKSTPKSQDSKGASTFRVKFDIGEHSEEAVPENMHLHQSVVKTLRDVIFFFGADSFAICEPEASKTAAEVSADKQNLMNKEATSKKAMAHKALHVITYGKVRSWEVRADFMTIEVAIKNTDPKSDAVWVYNDVTVHATRALLEDVQNTMQQRIQSLIARKKAERAAGAATAAPEKAKPAARSIAGLSKQDRVRRASLMVDCAAFADFAEDDDDEDEVSGLSFNSRSEATPGAMRPGASERRASLLADVAGIMGTVGGKATAEDEMAAAVAAIELEDSDSSVVGARTLGDVMGVLTTDTGEAGTAHSERRMSLVQDIGGTHTPGSGSERERRASFLVDLASFIEEGEDPDALGSITEACFDHGEEDTMDELNAIMDGDDEDDGEHDALEELRGVMEDSDDGGEFDEEEEDGGGMGSVDTI